MTTHDSLRAASHLNSYTLHSATELVEELKLLRPEGHSKDILTIGMVSISYNRLVVKLSLCISAEFLQNN